MENILLILSNSRQSPLAISEALQRAKAEGAVLTTLFILDVKLPASMCEKITENAFAGEKTSEQLYHSILIDHRERGRSKIMEIGEEAETMGVVFDALIKEGEFGKECLSTINETKPDLVIITRERKSFISRFVFGSVLESIQKETDSELLIIEG